MKIGIFSGTFDPFTFAHLAICEKVLEEGIVDKVIVLPTIVNWHREDKKSWLSYDDKFRVIMDMTWKCTDWRESIQPDFYELSHADHDWDETKIMNRRYVHMLSDVTFRYGIDNEYYTVIGTDSLWNFIKLWNYNTIFDMSKLIVVKGRDGIDLPDETFGAIEVEIDPKFAEMSASKIRARYATVDEYLADVMNRKLMS